MEVIVKLDNQTVLLKYQRYIEIELYKLKESDLQAETDKAEIGQLQAVISEMKVRSKIHELISAQGVKSIIQSSAYTQNSDSRYKWDRYV